MDLSKAVDWLNKDLLATLDAYGFDTIALKVIHSSLYEREQGMKVNGTFSIYCFTKLGVAQGSVLGPLLFSIFVNDIFYLVSST